jgi:exopolysaccharide biosynthesis protein
LLGLLGLPIILYGFAQFSRPARTADARSLFPGITYRREAKSLPRPAMIHVVTVDLRQTRPFVSSGSGSEMEAIASTPSEFVKSSGVQLAINANFFFPFREETPWDYYPRSGDPANLVGQAISNRQSYSEPQKQWVTLCFSKNRAQIESTGTCPAGTEQAVAGDRVLLQNGKPLPVDPEIAKKDKAYARTAVAIDRTGQKLWLILVDGKQFRYSEGLTIAELSDLITQLGADSALNLDGGGSTTLAIQTKSGVQVLNAPIQTKIPMQERPVANHLGFFADQ